MTDLRSDWQKRQAALCSCKGTDDYCPCQNVDFAAPKPTQPSIGMDEREEIARHVAALKRVKDRTPVYMGQGPKPETYQAIHAALDYAIIALSATPVDVGEVVKSAYLEGLGTGPDGGQTDDGGERCWLESDAYAALHDRLTGKDRGQRAG